MQKFEFNLEDNLFQLHQELTNKTYQHSHYTSFVIRDPKIRRIHKFFVRDRVLHHAVFRILYPLFDRGFVFDSYSCRLNKGAHCAVERLEKFCRKLSKNNSKNIFVLKCDIEKFFDSVDQKILLMLIKKKVKDKNAIWLINKILQSFEKNKGKGLPLGNVTSQLFANIYLNEFDQFVKHHLKIKYYLRYCDDFVILHEKRSGLMGVINIIDGYLQEKLRLKLHHNKIITRKYHQGIDFLGYVVLPHYRVLRTKTKNRIFKKFARRSMEYRCGLISEGTLKQSLQSYLGVFSHVKAFKLSKELENKFFRFA